MSGFGARFRALTGAALPIVQAPMAGAGGVALAAGAMQGGALASLPCALLTPAAVREQVADLRAAGDGPINLNFFCHAMPDPAPDETGWRAALAPYYAEEGVEPGPPPALRLPFDAAMADVVEAVRPAVVSFHFGLPDSEVLARVRQVARVFGNATSVDEARWLAAQGCDAVIVQGAEAGGHAGWFLERHRPVPLAELLPAVLAAVDVPVIAAGGLVDGEDVARVLGQGAVAAQIGTAYLGSPESRIVPAYRALLGTAEARAAAFTNVFSGRAARGIVNRLMREMGPMSPLAPAFPYASAALAPLRAHAEAEGRLDYTPLWAGAGAERVQVMTALERTRALGDVAAALWETRERA